SAAYVSMRVLTIGALTLLMIGLCCLAATILNSSSLMSRRSGATSHGPAADTGDQENMLILKQSTINKHFPTRIYPSHDRIFLGKNVDEEKDTEEMEAVAMSDTTAHLAGQGSTTPSPQHQMSGGTLVEDSDDDEDDRRQIFSPRSENRRYTFTVDLSHVKRPLGQNSLHCESAVNSPCPNQTMAVQMPSFTAIMMQEPATIASDRQESTVIAASAAADSAATISTEELCSICLGEYVINDHLRVLPCNHEYHVECIDIWLTTKSTYCPLCKHDLLDDISSVSPIQVSVVAAQI
ncbi:hypothetical protein BGZ99_006129, partial [Dissophora globulifera]